ncbi:hypothetical protein FOA52_014140 [Chlamydomonas sp. UWO 241]|nr:hypothetical protein FOA52_014140 [Chlamydomonas sp. UWO 241]
MGGGSSLPLDFALAPSGLPPSVEVRRVGGLAARPTDHASRCAVSLEWLVNSFLVSHPEIVAKRLSTADVVGRIILPATRCGCVGVNGWV